MRLTAEEWAALGLAGGGLLLLLAASQRHSVIGPPVSSSGSSSSSSSSSSSAASSSSSSPPPCYPVLSGTISLITISQPFSGSFQVAVAGRMDLSLSQYGGDLSLLYVSVIQGDGSIAWAGYGNLLPVGAAAEIPITVAGTITLKIVTFDPNLNSYGVVYSTSYCPS